MQPECYERLVFVANLEIAPKLRKAEDFSSAFFSFLHSDDIPPTCEISICKTPMV